MRLNWKHTFVIGLGFFGISLVWPIYNQYMPLLYAKYLESKVTIGVLMTLDNWLALTLTPLVGYLSDRTRSRFGRRLPYLLVGAPLAALFMALIPLGWQNSLGLLLAFSVLLNLAMASFRSPVVALMPDVTPPPLRSKANGVINFMGGLGFVVATLGGALLYGISPTYPFLAVPVLLIGVTLAFRFWIREPSHSGEGAEGLQVGKVADGSLLFLLLAIFFWFVAYNAVETWLTTYGTEHLGMEPGRVAVMLAFTSGAFLLMAIPAGMVAEGLRRGKRGLGRKWTILAGLAGMMAAYFQMYSMTDLRRGAACFLLAGIAWALVNINSYPMVTDMAGPGQIGAYTGLYYLFSSSANIAGPPLFGWVFDRWGYQPFFPLVTAITALAFLSMLLVRRGEAPRK